MSIVNSENLTHENVWRMIQSSTMLKILSNYDIELIFMDEFRLIQKLQKYTNGLKKEEKTMISHHCWAESYNIISVLPSKKIYPSEIK